MWMDDVFGLKRQNPGQAVTVGEWGGQAVCAPGGFLISAWTQPVGLINF